MYVFQFQIYLNGKNFGNQMAFGNQTFSMVANLMVRTFQLVTICILNIVIRYKVYEKYSTQELG